MMGLLLIEGSSLLMVREKRKEEDNAGLWKDMHTNERLSSYQMFLTSSKLPETI